MNELVEQILSNDKIPSPTAVAARLLELVSQADVGVEEIAFVLGTDPNLSAKLIGYCNSPIVGSKREIAKLQQAVMVLGLRKLRLLSISFSLMETSGDSDFDYDLFWRQSLATAVASKTLAARYDDDPDEMFLLGLVFNVGQIGIGNTFPEKVREMRGTESLEMGLTLEQEVELFESTRYQIGGKMLENWHFPKHMSDAVSAVDMEEPSDCTKRLDLSLSLADLLLSTETTASTIEEVRERAARLLGFDDSTFDVMFDDLIGEWKSYVALFEYDEVEFDSIADLEDKARRSMMDISMEAIGGVEEEKRQLQESALVDALTSLKNRRAYDSELPSVVSYHSRQQKSFGLLVVDIDHFKSFNDTHGHAVGDDVLKAVGTCMAEASRAYDNVYRYGGEEFVVVVQDCSYDDMMTVAERLRCEIESLDVGGLKVTASFGCCWTYRCEFNDFSELFAQADKQLYVAKERGRNQCVGCDFAPETAAV